jgi:thymidylate synthase ThyX
MRPSDNHITRCGSALVIHGLEEETIAMLFGRYSRSVESIADSIDAMYTEGHINGSAVAKSTVDGKTRQFHERITIGYGHKSVADHASVHWALEGVSALVERDYTSSRLIAATSKSTRFVSFRDAGFVTPENWPVNLRSEFEAHCEELLTAYETLVPVATEAVRQKVPYDPDFGWKSEAGWESATSKRALDIVRDLLPCSIRTSFGVTCSATALREILDKRHIHSDGQTLEVAQTANYIRTAASNSVVPTLLPTAPRESPRGKRLAVAPWISGGICANEYAAHYNTLVPPSVSLISKPDWSLVQEASGIPTHELVHSWVFERGHHMPPNRWAELPDYWLKLKIPFAIQRDLGRHRMMTQFEGLVIPTMGYGADPLISDKRHLSKDARLILLSRAFQDTLAKADARIRAWSHKVPQDALQYASPLAAHVPVLWKVNVRELVHILGLRTTPQGHPTYRFVVAAAARLIGDADKTIKPLIDEVTNYSEVIVGRPG